VNLKNASYTQYDGITLANGKRYPLNCVARKHGVDPSTMRNRLRAGKSVSESVVKPSCERDENGKTPRMRAKEQGLKFYEGNYCAEHDSRARYVSSNQCVYCGSRKV